MHELDSGIARWRNQMAEQLGQNPDVLDELESHLREEIDRLTNSGKTAADALALAIAKFGTPQDVASQFAHVTTPWLPIYFVVGCTALITIALLLMIGLSPAEPLLRLHTGTITTGYLLGYCIGVLSLCWAVRTLFGELPIGKRSMTVRTLIWLTWTALCFTLVGTLTGSVWARQHLGRYWDWDLREIGALMTLGWLAILLTLLRQASSRQRWLMSCGMLGKITIFLAWFVAVFYSTKSYGISQIPAQFLVLLVLSLHFGFYLLLVAGLMIVQRWRVRQLVGVDG